MKNVPKLVCEIKEINKENYVEIVFLEIIHREDRDRKDMIDDTNKY